MLAKVVGLGSKARPSLRGDAMDPRPGRLSEVVPAGRTPTGRDADREGIRLPTMGLGSSCHPPRTGTSRDSDRKSSEPRNFQRTVHRYGPTAWISAVGDPRVGCRGQASPVRPRCPGGSGPHHPLERKHEWCFERDQGTGEFSFGRNPRIRAASAMYGRWWGAPGSIPPVGSNIPECSGMSIL